MTSKTMKAFIIQARVGSTRLPYKILLPFFKDKSIIDIVIEKLQIFNIPIILATSMDEANDMLESIAHRHGIKCFRGDENDVLQRFISAAEEFSVDEVIRVCSDNPMLDVYAIQQLLEIADDKYDYVSFDIGGTPSIKTHFGFWTEYVTLDALKKVAELTSEPNYHEHVTNHIYTHPDIYNIKWISVEEYIICHPAIRTTIDTSEDFNTVQAIYEELVVTDSVTIQGVIKYAYSHPDVLQRMQSQININSK